MCIKRDQSYNYFDLVKPAKDMQAHTNGLYVCPTGYEACLDSESEAVVGAVNPDQQFCIPESKQCPVTSLVYSKGGSIDSLQLQTSQKYGPPL